MNVKEVILKSNLIEEGKEIGLHVLFMSRTRAFQSESTLYSCLNAKELLAQSRREI